jgi:hypothetical protein
MKRALGICVLLVFPLTLYAEVGDLKPVPGEAMQSAPLYAGGDSFTKCRKGDGTVSKHAMAVALKAPPPSNLRIKVAIDSDSPDSKVPNVVRLDFTRQGRFAGAPVVPLVRTSRGSQFNGQIGPATVQVPRGKTSLPVHVSGRYYKSGDYRNVTLSLSTALEGTCQFGEKTYPVRIIDGNSNLRCGDTTRPQRRGGKVRGLIWGDRLIVDTGDGKFGGAVEKSYYGHPVMVDGAWYDVKLSSDGTKVSATPSDLETAKLKIPHDRWTITLAGAKYVFALSGKDEPVEIPADRYTVTQFCQFDKGKRMNRLASGDLDARRGTAKALNVPAGETTELAIGTPLTASIKTKTRRRVVSMDFKLTDASGAETTVYLGKGGRPTPKLEVLDSDGKRVHSGNFEYG